jgi:hypothetical protein
MRSMQHNESKFVSKFTQTMKCREKIDGTACKHNYHVDSTDPAQLSKLAALHLDHDYDLNAVCTAWREAMPAQLNNWDDGVDGDLICHLLFGVDDHPKATTGDKKWKAAVHFRCGTSRVRRKGDFCHDFRHKNQENSLTSTDLRG